MRPNEVGVKMHPNVSRCAPPPPAVAECKCYFLFGHNICRAYCHVAKKLEVKWNLANLSKIPVVRLYLNSFHCRGAAFQIIYPLKEMLYAVGNGFQLMVFRRFFNRPYVGFTFFCVISIYLPFGSWFFLQWPQAHKSIAKLPIIPTNVSHLSSGQCQLLHDRRS